MSEIKNHDRASQVIDFTGLRYKTITPTDIDGALEYHNKAFAFFEMKLEGAPCPRGQTLFLTRLVDALCETGKEAALFICRHNVQDPHEDVLAEKTWVESIYYRHKWTKYKRCGTLKNWLIKWIDFACPEALEEKK